MEDTTLERIYQNAALNHAERQAVYAAFERVTINKGEFLLKEEQIANHFYCLENGLIRSYVIDFKGNDTTTNFFVNDEIVIEVASLFQRIPTKENIQAITDCVCWKIDFSTFQNLFHHIEGFREWGRGWLSQSLFHFKQRSVAIITDTATERYLELLNTKPQIIQQAPLKQIATYLGVTDTSLSRIRKEIAQKK